MRSSKIFWHMTAHSQGRKDVLHVAISLRPIAAIKVHILIFCDLVWKLLRWWCYPKRMIIFLLHWIWNLHQGSLGRLTHGTTSPAVQWHLGFQVRSHRSFGPISFFIYLFLGSYLIDQNTYIYMHMHVYLSMGVPGDASNNKWVPCKSISYIYIYIL